MSPRYTVDFGITMFRVYTGPYPHVSATESRLLLNICISTVNTTSYAAHNFRDSRPDSFPDMYRFETLRCNCAVSTTATRTRKKICCYLDNNRGNYLGDNNSRSSAGDSCFGHPPHHVANVVSGYANSCHADTNCYHRNSHHGCHAGKQPIFSLSKLTM